MSTGLEEVLNPLLEPLFPVRKGIRLLGVTLSRSGAAKHQQAWSAARLATKRNLYPQELTSRLGMTHMTHYSGISMHRYDNAFNRSDRHNRYRRGGN